MKPWQVPIAILFAVGFALTLVSGSPIPLFVVAFVFVITTLFNLLWNDTIPGIFGLRRISFWEAFRLLLLAWILFGGVFIRFNNR